MRRFFAGTQPSPWTQSLILRRQTCPSHLLLVHVYARFVVMLTCTCMCISIYTCIYRFVYFYANSVTVCDITAHTRMKLVFIHVPVFILFLSCCQSFLLHVKALKAL